MEQVGSSANEGVFIVTPSLPSGSHFSQGNSPCESELSPRIKLLETLASYREMNGIKVKDLPQHNCFSACLKNEDSFGEKYLPLPLCASKINERRSRADSDKLL